MSHKQFALIVAVWAAAMFFIFATPARSVEIGLVTASVTCMDSAMVVHIAEIRLAQLTEMIEKSEGPGGSPNVSLVLKAEAQGVWKLKKAAEMWRVENCRET